MTDNIGATLGKYDILEELGRGGFGAVYRVRNRDLDREEALKVLGRHRLWDPTFVRRFQREARAAARLRHPHIVTIYEVGEVDGSHFLSMEYLPGQTLARLIATEGALPLARASALISQVADALDYAHAQGLVHRDVKPSNIMVGPGDRVTLTDFGLVKAADHSELSQELVSSGAGLTTAAAAMGTPEYMAPELAEPNGAFDYRADIYSLAVVGYQALTGQLPFSAPTPVAVLRAQVDLPPPPLTQWAPGLPEPVCAAVLRGLAKNPRERYPSAGGFAAALAESAQRADAARARDEKLAGLYASAVEALAAKNWAAALAACGQVMTLNPGYRDVGSLFDQANAGLARQREWEAQQEEMAAQYDAAQAALAAGLWAEAIRLLTPLAAGDQVFRDADRRLGEAAAAQERETEQRRAQIDALYRKAQAAYAAAKQHVAEILALDPGWRDPEGTLNTLMNAPQTDANAAPRIARLDTSKTQAPAREQASAKTPLPQDAGELPRLSKALRVAPAVFAIVLLLAVAWLAARSSWPLFKTPGALQPAPSSSVDDMTQMLVPAGEFLMGSNDKTSSFDEQPQHRVLLKSYRIDQIEVTRDQYQKCVDAGKCAAPGCADRGAGNHPVVCVRWQDAANYCAWAGRRLPTEAEWEKAARGVDGRPYPWGQEPPNDQLANFAGAAGGTSVVGQHPKGASPFGALDMAGNVWEWTADWYLQRYYADAPVADPPGPDWGVYRVARGGGYRSDGDRLRASFRAMRSPGRAFDDNGFRCAQDAD